MKNPTKTRKRKKDADKGMGDLSPAADRRDSLRLVFAIIDHGYADSFVELLSKKHGIKLHIVCQGEGTADSAILQLLNLDKTQKDIVICVTESICCPEILHTINSSFEGNGVVFTIKLTSVGGMRTLKLLKGDIGVAKDNDISKREKTLMVEYNHELILTIINRGFSEVVMDAARERGATGGTIIHGRGTGAKEIEQFFNMIIENEKELVLIVAPKELRNSIMDGIMHAAGLGTEANGITFTLPVTDFVVLNRTHKDALRSRAAEDV